MTYSSLSFPTDYDKLYEKALKMSFLCIIHHLKGEERMKRMLILGLIIFIIISNIFIVRLLALNERSNSTSPHNQNGLLPEELVNETRPTIKIDDYFKSSTLDDHFGDKINQHVYLDSNHINYDDLRYLQVLHVGFDGVIHIGELIVNKLIAEEVLSIFREIYDIGFPIEKIKIISHYNHSDELSMEDNNTSAFNFRQITNGDTLSKHAIGLAIDINPAVNPYIKSNTILPTNAIPYIDRSQDALGLIKKDDSIYEIFKKYGWIWGGDWTSLKDYQHFEKTLD